uniref:Signal peptide peptidase SppA n=1 Tax=candidate division WOR-3 bacterium TaxID=2052148 RepID=A0A7V3ZUY1_UNCW3
MNERYDKILIILGIILIFIFFLFYFWWQAKLIIGEKIAFIDIQGTILKSEKILKIIEKCERDPKIKGVILKINSPGGSVAATYEIYESLKKLKEKKKIIVYLENIATSGGYYLALVGDKIVANPGAIIGSIGVRIDIPIVEGLFKKLGIKYEVIKSGKYKDIGSPFRDLTPKERALFEELINDVYADFFVKVKEARKMSEESLRKIADGRIFSAKKAKDFGLIDTLGTFNTALEIAKEITKVKKPFIVRFRRFWSFVEIFDWFAFKFLYSRLYFLP